MSEINPEEYMRGFEDGRNEGLRHKFEVVSGAPTNIRIEALRAAAAVSGSVIHEAMEQIGEPPNSTQAEEYTLKIAEAFVRWLETGER